MFKTVKSSLLKGYDYNEREKVLDVTFNNGRTFRYEGVKPNVVSELQNAPSYGKYFYKNIRKSYKFKGI